MSSPTQGSCAGISGSLWAAWEPTESLSLEPLSQEGTGWASECHSLPQLCASGFAQLTAQDAAAREPPGDVAHCLLLPGPCKKRQCPADAFAC